MFAGACAAICALAFSFAALSGVMYRLKGEFLLDNAQIGLIGGAGLWGMAISQIGFSSLCDLLGMRNLMRLAALGHLLGIVLIVTARGFNGLFIGALALAIANGMVEAVCNPLVATLFPDRKAAMLNRLHLWFPGGIVIGGLAVWMLAGTDWRVTMAIMVPPVLLYSWLFARVAFPPTEAAQNGIRVRDAFRAVAATPIFWLFVLLMGVTMSLELGPNRWIPAVLEAGGMPGILVLVLINGVMALARGHAHAVLERVPPPVLLATSTAIAGMGLLWLSFAVGTAQTVAAALVFAIGIAMVWPTMMGFVAERAPRTGALGLGLMAAAGSLAVGLVTTPLLGAIADDNLPNAVDAAPMRALAQRVIVARPADAKLRDDARAILSVAHPPAVTGDFLRRVSAGEAGAPLAPAAAALLHPAENRSGLLSFRYLVPFALLVSLVFALVAFSDRRKGGYARQVERARFRQGASQQ
ncbi:MAG: MFS transporter [Sphingobium sp.]|nr:MFS transporter [Sphingobium sp.]